jgi:AcrR family transcriptional regulator
MSVVKSRREQYSDATRNALVEEATRLFAERGFGATALEDIATATQVTRGAVYHHFANKRAVFETVLDRLETQALQRIAAAAGEHEDAWDAAMAGLEAFLDNNCDPIYGRLVWQEGPIALGWSGWRECEMEYSFGIVEQLTKALVAAGYVAETAITATSSRLIHELLGGAGMTIADADAADKRRVRDESSDFIRRLLNGIRIRD